VPLIIIIWLVFQWRWPISPLIELTTQIFIFFTSAQFFTSFFGPFWGLLSALPFLAAIDLRLRDTSVIIAPSKTRRRRSVTNLGVLVLSLTCIVAILGIITLNLGAILPAGSLLIYLLTIVTIILFKVPRIPIDFEPAKLRTVAGTEGKTIVILKSKTIIKSIIFLNPQVDRAKITPDRFILPRKSEMKIEANINPLLSGPSEISVKGTMIDMWGLTQTPFVFKPVALEVIPRARYIEFIAKKYISGSKPGQLPLISNVSMAKPLFGLRRGIEFYGNRLYQPGDNMKNIDWKHSVKYNKLISKEFSEVQTQPAVLIINTIANSPEEEDILAYNIVATAITMAREGIAATIAAYDDNGIVSVTSNLSSTDLVRAALEIIRKLTVLEKSTSYIDRIPDIERLRSNVSRLKISDFEPAVKLRELLMLEYDNLRINSRSSSCQALLNRVAPDSDGRCGYIFISNYNHDAESLAFSIYNLKKKGNAVISIDLASNLK
jgi:uncharacterized protein (DUF58 family)